MVGEKCGLTVLVLVNALFLQPDRLSIMRILFQLYAVLRFDSTIVINVVNSTVVKSTVVLINKSSPKSNNHFFLFRSLACMTTLLD